MRVGTFEYFAARGDKESLKLLLDYATLRHFPGLKAEQRSFLFLHQVINVTARLVAKWMSFGFIHGVMNTDNSSIAGDTIDYGPCAFMEEFKFEKVFSSIDRFGRYAYNQQANVAQWNCARLADCLSLLHNEEPGGEPGFQNLPYMKDLIESFPSV